VRVIAAPHRGKGATVTRGVLEARGELILFSDADLSVPLEETALLADALEAGADVAIGSRELPGSRREEEPGYRHLMGRGFNRAVQLLVLPGIQDTQCGFKLFRRRAAREVFSRLRQYGPDAPPVRGPMVTAFDVEVLFLARLLGFRVVEVPVTWVHGTGSKVRPVVDALRMARDVARVKWNALRGAYRRDPSSGEG
jgi:glycosyltransferase involved in cell wall biosynthesis